MRCFAVLISDETGKAIKSKLIEADTYPDCEKVILRQNSKLKNKHWKIATINT